MRRIAWALVYTMIVVGLVACGGGGNSDPAPPTANYYPTTQGSTWTYLDTANATESTSTLLITQSTSTAFSLKIMSSQNTDYIIAHYITLTNGAWGYVDGATYNANGVVQNAATALPPWQIVPSAWTVGSHETFTSTYTSTYPFPGGTISISADMTVIGAESITVPAGTFNNAIKVAATTTSSTETLWFADGVGMIKSVSSNASGTNTTELSSYTIQ